MQEPHGGGPERPGIIFKTWQIFIFSLIPLLLVFAGVIGGSIHGSDSEREVFPTPGPPPPPQGSPGPGGSTTLQIVASNLLFNPRSLAAPPEAQVTVRLDNRDAGVLHNFSVYRTNQATQQIFTGELHTGPGTKDYSFRAPGPGTYFFRCDVHPDTMTGTFNVR